MSVKKKFNFGDIPCIAIFQIKDTPLLIEILFGSQVHLLWSWSERQKNIFLWVHWLVSRVTGKWGLLYLSPSKRTFFKNLYGFFFFTLLSSFFFPFFFLLFSLIFLLLPFFLLLSPLSFLFPFPFSLLLFFCFSFSFFLFPFFFFFSSFFFLFSCFYFFLAFPFSFLPFSTFLFHIIGSLFWQNSTFGIM